jgi:hypothetical protein
LSGANGTVTTYVEAARVQSTCAPSKSTTITVDSDFYNIQGFLPNNCSATSYAQVKQTGTWFGWGVPAPFECVKGINPAETNDTDPGSFYAPVAFSFFKNASAHSMVFCYSTITQYNVYATLTLSNSTSGITNVYDEHVVGSLGFAPNG